MKARKAIAGLAALAVLAMSTTVFAKTTKTIEGVVNINTGTVKELQLLPGIGKGKAEAIVAYRNTNPFKTLEDLMKVNGIGKGLFAKVKVYVTLTGPTTAKEVKQGELQAKSN